MLIRERRFGTHPDPVRTRTTLIAVMALLSASALCIGVAPAFMPETYRLVVNAVSESGAQGVENAWIARTGFLLLGFAVLVLVTVAGERWGFWARLAHRGYGIAMIAAAAYSHSPWEPGPFDQFEDFLHSVAASSVGLAFTAGVLFVSIRRTPRSQPARAADWAAIAAALVLPLLMFNMIDVAGALQRVLFGVGYLWYGSEALRSLRELRLTEPPKRVPTLTRA